MILETQQNSDITYRVYDYGQVVPGIDNFNQKRKSVRFRIAEQLRMLYPENER